MCTVGKALVEAGPRLWRPVYSRATWQPGGSTFQHTGSAQMIKMNDELRVKHCGVHALTQASHNDT